MAMGLPSFFVNNWATFVTFAVGTIIALVLYWRGTRVRRPRYAVRSINFIEGAKSRYPDLTIRYAGFGPASGLEKLENFSVAMVAVWNAGRESIRKQDIASADPIRITASAGCTILDASVIQSAAVNQLAVTLVKKDNVVLISFDHLGHNEGGVIQVLHTGAPGSEITVDGAVIDGGKPVHFASGIARFIGSRLRGKKPPSMATLVQRRMWAQRIVLIMILIVAIPLLAVDFFDPAAFANYSGMSAQEIAAKVEELRRQGPGWSGHKLITGPLLVGYCMATLWGVWQSFRLRVPKSVSKFDTEF